MRTMLTTLDRAATATTLRLDPVHQAAAAHIANEIYNEATAALSDTAALLAAVLDHLPHTMPGVFRQMGLDDALAAHLQPEVTRRLRAFRAVEAIRGEAGPYGWICDVLIDGLRRGAPASAITAQLPQVLHHLHAWKAAAAAEEGCTR